MKKFLFLIVLNLCCRQVMAEDYHANILEAERNAPAQIKTYQADAVNAKFAAQSLLRAYQEKAALTDAANIVTPKQMPSILIFVSFSMPEQSLEDILRDAKKVKASVVIRGLVDNSLQKTFQRVASLVKAAGGGGVELNPLWFKRFEIKAVPAVVVVPDNSACYTDAICKSADFAKMTGDIPLVAALTHIHDRSHLPVESTQSSIQTLETFHA